MLEADSAPHDCGIRQHLGESTIRDPGVHTRGEGFESREESKACCVKARHLTPLFSPEDAVQSFDCRRIEAVAVAPV